MLKYVYSFGPHGAEGNAQMTELLGGKGAGLAEMCNLGLPVPAGFTITTEACREFFANGLTMTLLDSVKRELQALERLAGKRFGCPDNPLILAVRSGAKISMPGMMDTVHYVGLNEQTAAGLPKRLADDCLQRLKDREGWAFPADPFEQLTAAITRVFNSWNSATAKEFRALHEIPDLLGTACNVQVMVFGNMDERSGTGVAFTRDPSTGRRTLFGEFVPMSPGDDLVRGLVTPRPLDSLAQSFPKIHMQLCRAGERLEIHYRDLMEVEFTVESGRLWLLQVTAAKCSISAKVRTAVEMAENELLTQKQAILRIAPEDLSRLQLKEVADPNARVVAKGIGASRGATIGQAVFSHADVPKFERPILLRPNPDRDDIKVIEKLAGLVTVKGGAGSHFSVIARNRGIPAVVGCENGLRIRDGRALFGEISIDKGDCLTIDGSSGNIFIGEVPLSEQDPGEALHTLLNWCDRIQSLSIRVFADSADQVVRARESGVPIAISTERMFMDQGVSLIEKAILAETEENRQLVHGQIQQKQRDDFEQIFRLVATPTHALPTSIVIRLLDPPLSEFLPAAPSRFHQNNPLFGHRGCRLYATHPELYRLQIRAIFQAMRTLEQDGFHVQPVILVPLISAAEELAPIRALAGTLFTEIFGASCPKAFTIGSMIETPRAALTCREISRYAGYLAFGLMDLTQCVFGASRDDASAFLPFYLQNGAWPFDPFSRIDQEGVGRLMSIAVQDARRANPEIQIEVTAWDPSSIRFIQQVLGGKGGLVCPLPFLPQAKLAAAQAALTSP